MVVSEDAAGAGDCAEAAAKGITNAAPIDSCFNNFIIYAKVSVDGMSRYVSIWGHDADIVTIQYSGLECFHDTHERLGVERSATDKTAVDVGFCEELGSIARLAAAAVKD